MRWLRSADGLWFLGWAAASSVWCLTAAARLGPTFDEPTYFERGLEAWRTHSHYGLLQLGTMPLPMDLHTLLLYLWERAHGVTLDPQEDLAQGLFWMRAPNLLFWWRTLAHGRLPV